MKFFILLFLYVICRADNIDDIIKMSKASVNNTIIESYIQNIKVNINPDQIIKLSTNKISNNIILKLMKIPKTDKEEKIFNQIIIQRRNHYINLWYK